MDSLFDALGANNKAMISIAISQNGSPVYSRTTGYSRIEGASKTAATEQTRYRIGSITKVFTGVMIFQLIEEGKIGLTTSLAKFFPGMPNADKITIAHMLNHSSGLHNFTSDSTYLAVLDKKTSQAELLAKFKNAKPVFEPGAKHEYSNTNYVLLGYILEKLDKTNYAEALKRRITGKIGLANTYYGDGIHPEKKEADSYFWKDGWQPATETHMSIPGGAGALVSTPSDLVRFMEALFSGKLVSEQSLAQMQKTEGAFGMALFSYPFNDKTAYGHNGGIDGFQSQATYFPREKVAIAYAANGVNTQLNPVMIGVLSILFNVPYTIPSFKTAELKSEDLDKLTGLYSSAQLPLKITISRKDGALVAQATGQAAFTLEARSPSEFRFDPAGIILIFDAAKDEMLLKQGGQDFHFKRESR